MVWQGSEIRNAQKSARAIQRNQLMARNLLPVKVLA